MGAGAALVVAAGAAEAPAPPRAGRRSVVPASSGRAGPSPLAAASRDSDTPLRAAIPLSVSPRRTRRPPAAGVVPAAGAPAEPLAPAPAALPAAGMVSRVPATTCASAARPLAAARRATEIPL